MPTPLKPSCLILVAASLLASGDGVAQLVESTGEPEAAPETLTDTLEAEASAAVDAVETDDAGIAGDAIAPADDVVTDQPTDLADPATEAEAAGMADAGDDVILAPVYDQAAAMRRYEGLMRGGEYRAAVDVAESMLARSDLRYGRDAREHIPLLEALAAAQLANGAGRDAEATLVRLVQLIESMDGIFDESLIEPLTELGHAHKQQGELEASMTAYIRARHITHRKYGVTNGEQLSLMDLMTELHVAMGDLRDANREQRLAYRITDTNCGADDVCRVDGLYKLARWYQRTRRYTQARGLYKDALEILEANYGTDHVSLVPALHGVARTYEQQAQRFGEGRRSLERAASILDAQPYADLTEHVEAHVKLGDWHNLSNDHEEARAAYERAWEVMSANDRSDKTSLAVFGLPLRLRYRPPTPEFGDPAWHESRLEGAYVVVEFDVNELGRVENATVVDATTSARIRKEVRDAVRRAKYRPRMEDGVPVRADKVRLRQSFEYVSIYQQQRDARDAARRGGVRACAGAGCPGASAVQGVPIEVTEGDADPDENDGILPSDGAAVSEEVP